MTRHVDLNAISHKHTMDAMQRFRIEVLDMPVGDEGDNILMEDGDDLLAENGDFLVSDGSVETNLTYKLGVQPHNYVLDALSQHPAAVPESFAQAFVPGKVALSVATYDVSFGWAYATTVPVKALTVTGYAPTIVKTYDDLLTENDEFFVQEVSGDRILIDV